ncbi:MAG: ABC transporter ATP-binding protein/permease [Oscillospiraceae bacterium]|jgi:ATP-binding cassette subfamily B protein|nr:ABC transporter ATP-binding protein/permease [Oscillospiraceae bacterium]
MIALMRRIVRFAGKYKGRIYAAMVFSFLKSLLSKAPIFLAFDALTVFYNGGATSSLALRIGISMGVCVILQIVFQHLDNVLQSSAGFLVMADKRMALGAHLRRLSMGYFTEGNIGKISSVLTSDMTFVENNCMMVLADLISYIFAQIIMVAFLLVFNVWLGLVAAAICAVAILIAKGMDRQTLADSAVSREQSENLTEAVLDHIEGIGIIKTYNLLGEKSRELSENFEKTCKESLVFEKHLIPWQTWLNIVFSIGSAAVIALAAAFHASAAMTAVAVVGILLFGLGVFGPIRSLYGQSMRLSIMNSCLDRMEEVFAEPELPDNGTSPLPKDGGAPEMQFENVSFAYGEKEVLSGVSFALPKNKMVALVGPSGGGKSTVASLLPRFWDVKSGAVRIRGVDVREIPLKELLANISMVFQRVYLFQDTIYNNIALGRPDATEDEVCDAARKARCYDFIQALPDGFQTVVGEGGETLSGGEKQRISIARCILKDAPIIILDEATASVDADNESYIQAAISELCRGKTLIVIAHRLNTIRHADEILVVADGKIAERGSHDALLRNTGIYRSFVTARENARGWSRIS